MVSAERLHARPVPPSPMALFRVTQGLTQRAVAAQTGMTRETLSRIESGQVWPNPVRLCELATVYGRSLSDVLQAAADTWLGARRTP